MTANEIIEGVSMAIATVMPGVTVIMEDLEQGIPEPGFSIAVVQASRSRLVGHRFENSVPLDIRYFPTPGDEPNREINEVAESLYPALDIITTPSGEKVRGVNMYYDIVDNVLHFMVTYSGHLLQEVETGPMQERYRESTEVHDGKTD